MTDTELEQIRINVQDGTNPEESSRLMNMNDAVHNDGHLDNNTHTSNVTSNESDTKICPLLPIPLQKCFPPQGVVANYLTRVLVCVVIWAGLIAMIGSNALPGGNIFSIYILLITASFGGFFVGFISRLNCPPLLGMLIVGFLFRNVEAVNIAKDIHPNWSSTLRSIALVIILLRSGLGLDIDALKRLKFTVLRLAFVPCTIEALTVAITAHLLLGMPWLWAFQLGFILGAVSPAVVVPSMLRLQEDGYGVKEGIPTLVMAASSCDDVLAISMFGVFLGIAFSEGDLYFNIFRGPLEIIMGLAGGLLIGILLWYFPPKDQKERSANRAVLLVAFGLLFLFGSNEIDFPGAGALGVLTLGATVGYGWGDNEKAPVEKVTGVLWEIFQPLLFGLIGAEVSIEYLNKDLVGKSIGILVIGLFIRFIVTYLVTFGNNLSVKERLFCAIAWLPKATVQAAIGSIPLITARDKGFRGKEQEELGIKIVTIAVLVILITAPIGAVGIMLSGPRWLNKPPEPECDSN